MSHTDLSPFMAGQMPIGAQAPWSRVMIVEDNALIGMLFAQMLTALGHEICAIEATEAGAVATAARERPDLIIADVRLRTGSGLAAVRRILETRFVPHLFVTGDISQIRGKLPDAVVVQKPFTEAELVEAIGRAMLTRRL